MRQPFGQNFLVDQNIAHKIVAAADLHPDDTVIEIGPGKGVLTSLIAPQVKSLYAIEIDRNFAPALANQFRASPHVRIINEDFMKFAVPCSLLPAARSLKYISNLPYNVSTAIIEKILPGRDWTSAVFMVQKEVGERIAASPSTGEYGSFTVFCRYYCRVETILNVPPGCFAPPPKVDSVVLRLTNLLPKPAPAGLFDFVRAAFGQRRKTIHNSLANNLNLSKETVGIALATAGIDPRSRPETISLESYQTLFSCFPRR